MCVVCEAKDLRDMVTTQNPLKMKVCVAMNAIKRSLNKDFKWKRLKKIESW